MIYYVYIIHNPLTNYRYIGQTSDIRKRLMEHNNGKTKSLRGRGPFELVYSEEYLSRSEAVKRERFFKTGKGREELMEILARGIGAVG